MYDILILLRSYLVMQYPMNSICLFIHYSESKAIPEYVRIFVNELSHYFTEVKLLSNPGKELGSGEYPHNVEIVFQPNEGYDFGRIFTYLPTINLDSCGHLGIVNDSNLLIKKLNGVFDWDEVTKYDLWGMIDSYEKPWFSTHKESYHIQSHFLVLNSKAITELPGFFSQIDTVSILEQKDPALLRRIIIDKWEIGLTQYLLSKGLSTGTLIDSKYFNRQHYCRLTCNPTYKLYKELVEYGYPLLKRKVYLNSGPVSSKKRLTGLKNLISVHGSAEWTFKILESEIPQPQVTGSDTLSVVLDHLRLKKIFRKKSF